MEQVGLLLREANREKAVAAIRPKGKDSTQKLSLYSEGYFLILIGPISPQHTADNSSSNLVLDRATWTSKQKFCKFCGIYRVYAQNAGNFIPRCEKGPFRNIVSKSWKDIYKKK